MQNTITKQKQNTLTYSDLVVVLYSIAGFFIGRTIVFQFLNPIAISYLFLFTGVRFYIVALFVAIGLFTKLSGMYFFKYLAVIGLMCFFRTIKIVKRQTITQNATCILLPGLALAIANASLFFTIVAFIETLLCLSINFIIKPVLNKDFSTEKLIGSIILLSAIICGTSDMYIGHVSIMYICCTFILLATGNINSSIGLALGLILNVCGVVNLNHVIIFGIVGVSTGLLLKFKKLGSIIGFIISAPLIILYTQPELLTKDLLIATILGITLFIIVPFDINTTEAIVIDDYIMRIKKLTNYRLKAFAHAFSKLSVTFNNLAEKNTSQKDISKLIDELGAKVCNQCSMRTFCWENNFYNTYQTIFGILGACERKSRIDISDIPHDFRNHCANLVKFCETTNRLFELHKINLAWSNKIIESRELISQQLLGVSKIIDNLACELDLELRFNNELEQKITDELSRNKIIPQRVIVLETNTDKLEVTLDLQYADLNKKFVGVISKAIDKRLRIDDLQNNTVKLVEEQQFNIVTGVARATKNNSNESGDSYSVMELKNGQCLLVLSDGMGSGKRAKLESTVTVELLEELIESGFDRNTAIKLINSTLILKSNDETFSTLDVCFIDLYTGAGEFIKTGAASSFLLRDGHVQTIKSSSLPIGILNNIELELHAKKFRHDDIIIMATDGVTDVLNINDSLNLNSNHPQDIADYILTQAKQNGIKDDMTVIVARVWEKS